MLLAMKRNIGVMLISLLLSGGVMAGETNNANFTVVNIQGGQDESLDDLQSKNQVNQNRVLELEQKMIELLQQLKGKEDKIQMH